MENEYFAWLCDLVDIGPTNFHRNVRLARTLHKSEFRWFVANDDNRANDGLLLRDIFGSEMGYPYADRVLRGPCSMLELLIGLANRMGFQLYTIKEGEQPKKWFWELLHNMGVDHLTDDVYTHDKQQFVKERILQIVNRDYKRNGEGGLFPLKGSVTKDQKRVELWYQMQAYIMEKHPI